MRHAAAVMVFLGVGACNPPNSGGSGAGGSIFSRDRSSGPSFFSGVGSEKEEWEIVCGAYNGPDRLRMADDLAAALKRVPQLDPKRVRVMHDEQASRITYGPYLLGYNEKGHIAFTEDMQRDVTYIRGLSVNDQFPFFTATKQPVPTPDIGPKELDLRHARGVYSLQIGYFYNTPTFHQRKEAAVEWVRDLRSRGFEGYYFHGPKGSVVTVGAFDEGAYIQHKVKDRNSEVVVPRGPARDYRQDVIKMMQNPEFAYNHVNAAVEKVGGVAQSSFLVPIPRREDAGGRDMQP